MDTLYYDGREDGDSPILSPLTPNFDRYMPRGDDSSPYFGDASTYGAFPGVAGSGTAGDPAYSLAARGSLSDGRTQPAPPFRPSGFPLDLLPTGDTLPRGYRGGGGGGGTIDPTLAGPPSIDGTVTGGGGWDLDSSSVSQAATALYGARGGSEEFPMQQQQQGYDAECGSFDGYANEGYCFLPSPTRPDASGERGGYGTTKAGGPSRSARGKKHSSNSSNSSSGSGGRGSATSLGSDRKKRKHAPSTTTMTKTASPSTRAAPADRRTSSDEKSSRTSTQLRTASRAPKRYSAATARRPAESAEEVKARAAHNQVEQQYRKRLNQQFERLLAVLPQPDDYYNEEEGDGGGGCTGDSGGGGGAGRGMDKRISKAEVLDLARRRIKALEKERASLERQKKELSACVIRMQEEWTRRMGGVPVKSEGKIE